MNPLSNLDAKAWRATHGVTEITQVVVETWASHTVYVTHYQVEAMSRPMRIGIMDAGGHELRPEIRLQAYDNPRSRVRRAVQLLPAEERSFAPLKKTGAKEKKNETTLSLWTLVHFFWPWLYSTIAMSSRRINALHAR